jgi:hypothetical protein
MAKRTSRRNSKKKHAASSTTLTQRDLTALFEGSAISGQKLLAFAYEYDVHGLSVAGLALLESVRSISDKSVLYVSPADATDANTKLVARVYQQIRDSVSGAVLREHLRHPFFR